MLVSAFTFLPARATDPGGYGIHGSCDEVRCRMGLIQQPPRRPPAAPKSTKPTKLPLTEAVRLELGKQIQFLFSDPWVSEVS